MLRRILIDCALIDFSRQLTGIPRVVTKYLHEGYIWGQKHGYEIVPVIPKDDGLWITRPLPICLSREHRNSLEDYLHDAPTSRTWRRFLPQDRARRKLGSKIVVNERDILFCPAYWHDINPVIYQNAASKGAFIVTLVHDLLPILFERCYNAPWRYVFRDNAIAALDNSNLILTVSRYTLNAVNELASRSLKSMPPAIVAYNGFEPLTRSPAIDSTDSYLGNRRVARVLGERKPPFLMVGTVEPKKGHVPVIAALEQMWDAGFDRDLVIVGRRGWLEEPVVTAIEGSSYFNSRLFWFDKLDDTDLAQCYLRSHALIFASLGEGFGIPMIEAAAYRKPVIVYDTEIAHEILGSRGIYFSNGFQFVDAILQLENEDAYSHACSAQETFQWPSWGELAPQVFDQMAKHAAKKSRS